MPDKHLGESYRNPPAKLFSSGGDLSIRHVWSGSRVNTKDKSTVGQATSWRGGTARDRWVDWSFVIRWSHKNDGVFKAYKDGKLISARQGPNTFNDAVAPKFTIGIYKADWTVRPGRSNTSQRVFYVDDLRIVQGGSAEIGNKPVYGSGGGRVGGGGSGSRGNRRPVGGNPGNRSTFSPRAPIPRRTPTDRFSRLLPTIGNYRDVSLPSIN